MLIFEAFLTQFAYLSVLASQSEKLSLMESFADYYEPLREDERVEMLQKSKEMFHFGYDNYMRFAFPMDELDPIHCTGRGHDTDDPDNININDVLGDYALTLIDTLDTLALMGNITEFKRAVTLVTQHVSFDTTNEVQVFEATIRVLGGLLSAHMLIVDDVKPFGDLKPDNYDNELLILAHDLANRLLPSFSGSETGLPYPRVNLRDGVGKDVCRHCINETCSSCATSLLLEFGMLSILLNDPVYYLAAFRSVKALWDRRANKTGLIGNVINIQTGEWTGIMSGIGAGLDSVYEYMLKAAILFGDRAQMKMFEEAYENIKTHLRKGRTNCGSGEGIPPFYTNVNMWDGSPLNNWMDSLAAAWPGVQVLHGDLEEAVCLHLLYFAIWRKYSALPERWNWSTLEPDVLFAPLRPELAESTYLLYQATNSPFYLRVGIDLLNGLNNYTKVRCGYATIHNVKDKSLEDRMESFFLSETCKYLYLLFDRENPLNRRNSPQYLFTTEGHLFPIKHTFRERLATMQDLHPNFYMNTNITGSCTKIKDMRASLPIHARFVEQIENILAVELLPIQDTRASWQV